MKGGKTFQVCPGAGQLKYDCAPESIAECDCIFDVGSDFLGSQGDIWDAQWDMFLALVGAMIAMLPRLFLSQRPTAQRVA